jgi:hypothetical protein
MESADEGYETYRTSTGARTLRAALRQTREGDEQAETYGQYAAGSAVVGGALLSLGVYWLMTHPTIAAPDEEGLSILPWWDGRSVGIQFEME